MDFVLHICALTFGGGDFDLCATPLLYFILFNPVNHPPALFVWVDLYWGVAKLVRHQILDLGIAGSSPAAPAILLT